MASLLDRVSKVLGVEPYVLEREALLKHLISEELGETDVFEDLTRLDYLLDREEKLRKLIEELRGS